MRFPFFKKKTEKLSPKKGQESFVETKVFTPKSREQESLGNLLICLEIEGFTKDKNLNIVEDFFNILKKKYYSKDSTSCLSSFERSLQKVNLVLADLAKEGKNFWIGKIHAVICAIKDSEIHITKAGNAHLLLVRENKILNITKNLNSNVKNPLKTFEDIVSGKLKTQDKIILATKSLLQDIPITKIERTVSESRKETITSNLNKLLDSNNFKSNAGALLVEIEKDNFREEKYTQKKGKLKINRFNPLLKQPDRTVIAKPSWQNIKKEKDKKINQESRLTRIARQREESTFLGKAKKSKQLITTSCGKAQESFVKQGIPKIKKGMNWIGEKSSKLTKNSLQKIQNFNKISKDEISQEAKKVVKTGPSRESKQLNLEFLKFSFRKTVQGFKASPLKSKVSLSIASVFLIVLVVSVSLSVQKNKAKKEQKVIENFFLEAQRKKEEAEAVLIYDDTRKAKALLQEASDLNGKVLGTSYFREEASKLKEEIENKIDKTNFITRIKNPTVLTDLSNLGSNIETKGIFSIGNKVYSFNPKSNTLYSYDLKTKKNSVEASISQDIGKILLGTQANDDKESKELFFYTDKPGAAQFTPEVGKITPLSINFNEREKNITGIQAYGSKIYLLDALEQEIFKHSKGISGYFKGIPWLRKKVDLKDTISFAIDGYIYVLKSDSNVVKFLKGIPVNFSLQKIEPELKNPTEIFTGVYVQNLYILDPENSRIVVFDKEGKLITQYIIENIGKIKKIFVEPQKKKCFLLSENKVLEFPIN